MIVQCEQCSTRFKLDDSKVRDEGVKVRCSKCKHIFIAKKERPDQVDDADFDSLLSGLLASPNAIDSTPGTGAVSSDSDPSALNQSIPVQSDVQQLIPASESFDFENTFSEIQSDDKAAPELPSAELNKADAEATDAFAFESTSADSFAMPKMEKVETAQNEVFNVDFENDSIATGNESSALNEGSPFEFNFEPEAGVSESGNAPEQPPSPFEFAFEETDKESQAIPADSPFEFARETAHTPEKEVSPFDFAFEAEATSSGMGVMSDNENQTRGEQNAFGVQKDDEFSFEEADIPPESGLVGGDDIFSENSRQFEFDQVSSSEVDDQPESPWERDSRSDDTDVAASDSGVIDYPAVDSFAPANTSSPEHEQAESVKSSDTVAVVAGETNPFGTRRREHSLLPAAITAISVLVIIVLAGAGFYMLNKGPAAFEKLGVGSIAKLVGIDKELDGVIMIRNASSDFLKNKEAGEIMVIRGEAVNAFSKPRASIQVKATIFDSKGTVLGSRNAYCGNPLTMEQLTTLPTAKLEAAMSNQFGDSLSNLGIQPGKSIPFVIVFTNVSVEAKEFSLEIAGSTVSSK